MRYVESPSSIVPTTTLFLAGGITGCPDWQSYVVRLLADSRLTLMNPRRKIWSIDDLDAGRVQIEWEHTHLCLSQAILFWFPRETLCPITLYELGAWARSTKHIFVGTDPGYARRFDVVQQLRLQRRGLKVVDSLDDLVEQVKAWEVTL